MESYDRRHELPALTTVADFLRTRTESKLPRKCCKYYAVTTAFGNSYGYDANGNQITRTISSTIYTLVYDYENRLTEVKQGTSTIAKFWYDADATG